MKNIDELIDYIETFQNEKNWSNEIWLIKCAAITLKDKSKGQTLPIASVDCQREQLSGSSEITSKILSDFQGMEEECIKNVLRQLLLREPVLEDAKDLTKWQEEGEFNKYYLSYKGKKLGTVIRDFAIVNNQIGVKFIPFEQYDILEPDVINGKANF